MRPLQANAQGAIDMRRTARLNKQTVTEVYNAQMAEATSAYSKGRIQYAYDCNVYCSSKDVNMAW